MRPKMENLEIDEQGFVQLKEKGKPCCYKDSEVRFAKLEPWYETWCEEILNSDRRNRGKL